MKVIKHKNTFICKQSKKDKVDLLPLYVYQKYTKMFIHVLQLLEFATLVDLIGDLNLSPNKSLAVCCYKPAPQLFIKVHTFKVTYEHYISCLSKDSQLS